MRTNAAAAARARRVRRDLLRQLGVTGSRGGRRRNNHTSSAPAAATAEPSTDPDYTNNNSTSFGERPTATSRQRRRPAPVLVANADKELKPVQSPVAFAVLCLARPDTLKTLGPGNLQPEPEDLGRLKAAVRASGSHASLEAYHLLAHHLEAKDSRERFLGLCGFDALFSKSKAFRKLVCANTRTLMQHAVGIDTSSPLPKPAWAAEALRERALELLELWTEAFGATHAELALTLRYLRDVRKLRLPNLRARQEATRQAEEERRARTQSILSVQFARVVCEMRDAEGADDDKIVVIGRGEIRSTEEWDREESLAACVCHGAESLCARIDEDVKEMETVLSGAVVQRVEDLFADLAASAAAETPQPVKISSICSDKESISAIASHEHSSATGGEAEYAGQDDDYNATAEYVGDDEEEEGWDEFDEYDQAPLQDGEEDDDWFGGDSEEHVGVSHTAFKSADLQARAIEESLRGVPNDFEMNVGVEKSQDNMASVRPTAIETEASTSVQHENSGSSRMTLPSEVLGADSTQAFLQRLDKVHLPTVRHWVQVLTKIELDTQTLRRQRDSLLESALKRQRGIVEVVAKCKEVVPTSSAVDDINNNNIVPDIDYSSLVVGQDDQTTDVDSSRATCTRRAVDLSQHRHTSQTARGTIRQRDTPATAAAASNSHQTHLVPKKRARTRANMSEKVRMKARGALARVLNESTRNANTQDDGKNGDNEVQEVLADGTPPRQQCVSGSLEMTLHSFYGDRPDIYKQRVRLVLGLLDMQPGLPQQVMGGQVSLVALSTCVSAQALLNKN